MVSGCGSNSNKSEDLSNYVNQIDVGAETSTTAMMEGTIEQIQEEQGRTFVLVKVSRFQIQKAPGSQGNSIAVRPGTNVVIEVRNPKEEFPVGKKIRSSLHVERIGGGCTLIAYQVEVY